MSNRWARSSSDVPTDNLNMTIDRHSLTTPAGRLGRMTVCTRCVVDLLQSPASHLTVPVSANTRTYTPAGER